SLRTLSWTSANGYLQDGTLEDILLMGIGITKLGPNKDVLRDTDQTLRALVAASPLPILAFDLDANVRMWNPAAERVFGWAESEVLGRPLPIVSEDQKDEHQALLDLGRQGKSLAGVEVRRQRRDGSPVDISIWTVPMYGATGQVSGIVSLVADITERKQAEELFRTLSNSSPIGIYIVQDGKFQFANPQFQECTGRRKEELLGTDSTKLVAPDFRDSVRKNAISMLKGERSNPYEFQMYSKSGQTRWIMETVAPIQYQGRRAVLGNFMDITNWKQAEENLKQSLEKLRKTLEGTIQAMALTVEMRDPYTAGHQRRVANLACAIAREMQLSREQVDITYLATVVHDIGKICVPAEILSKPGRISDIEFGLIKAHSQVGYDILKTIEFPWPIAEIVLQHHERMDGSGYPSGLMGRESHLEARILGVADVVEAMASHRPYRPALGIEIALQEISHNSGTLYDPEVVDACLRLLREKGFRLE
ncbi:MAG: PAS domain S-box protein, partial [Chloroflexi bacterium]|nr:PAS domain S-box protein [Chloroflexota bacterium]